MKLKQFFHPLDTSFSTSIVARILLRLFFLALQLSLLGGLYVYLSSSFDREVTQRRSYMNAAILHAQRFFTGHEVLLRSLSLSTVRDTHLTQAVQTLPAVETHIHLGTTSNAWSLWLTPRALTDLRKNKINLLYIQAGPNPLVTRLTPSGLYSQAVASEVLEKLERMEQSFFPAKGQYWLSAAENLAIGESGLLYLFSLLDERDPNSGWLGLEVEGLDIASSMDRERAGDFVVLDALGEEIFTSTVNPALAQAMKGFEGDHYFGFSGGGLFPDYLILRKQLGYADLQLVYSIKFHSLVLALRKPLSVAALLALTSVLGLGLLVRHIEKRLITPAIFRKQALIESEAFSRTVIQAAPVALCVLRRCDGAVVLENTLSRLWLGKGLERESLCHGWIEQAYDPDERNCTDEFKTAERHLHLNFTPTRYRGEDVLLCAFNDISNHKQVELALEHSKQVADKANEAKTLFLATMSHEIRTPLYGALGTLELLARTELNPRQQEYLQAIQGSSSTLLQLICDVLDVSKIEAGQLVLEVEEFAPLELIQDVVKGYSAAAQSKELQLYSLIDPRLPERLIGDVGRIRQILNNLLNNAVKFTENGCVVIRINVASCIDERVTVLWQVSDTGQGIAQEDQPFLFDPFFQVGSRTNVVKGTGLGLSICQRLTDLMSGSMRVVSEPGLGSSFTLSLPLEQIQALALANPAPLLAETVYVASSIPELTENMCGWLRRWGAKAQRLRPDIDISDNRAVLVELHLGECQRALKLDWPGPVVVACNKCYFSQSPVPAQQWRVGLSDLQYLRQAVSQAQGLSDLVDPGSTAFSAYSHLGLRVLVVEDNAISQLILKDQLEELGCEVDLASDGLEALALWRRGRFDVVLTDINMPRMNGYELAVQLRLLGCSIPIIGATANAQNEERARCLAVGMDECLVKPFGLNALFNCLEQPRRKTHAL